MLRILKFTLVVMLLSILNAAKVSAGAYWVEGYIKKIKVNNVGPTCFILLSKQNGEAEFVGGHWSCNSYYANAMFEVARNAKVQGLKVYVRLERDETGYKQVYSIRME